MKMILRIALMCFGMLVGSLADGQIPHIVPPGTTAGLEIFTGNALLTHCHASNTFDQDFCVGYIIGVADLVGNQQTYDDSRGNPMWRLRTVCFPNEITVGQIQDVVIKYLIENREKRAEPAAQLVVAALIKAWGCPAK